MKKDCLSSLTEEVCQGSASKISARRVDNFTEQTAKLPDLDRPLEPGYFCSLFCFLNLYYKRILVVSTSLYIINYKHDYVV